MSFENDRIEQIREGITKVGKIAGEIPTYPWRLVDRYPKDDDIYITSFFDEQGRFILYDHHFLVSPKQDITTFHSSNLRRFRKTLSAHLNTREGIEPWYKGSKLVLGNLTDTKEVANLPEILKELLESQQIERDERGRLKVFSRVMIRLFPSLLHAATISDYEQLMLSGLTPQDTELDKFRQAMPAKQAPITIESFLKNRREDRKSKEGIWERLLALAG